MTIDEALTNSLFLFMQKGKGNGLEYVSRSHTAAMGWYFWLYGVAGVYELELENLREDATKADFYLRYYPDTEEDVLLDYSVGEQLLRFNENFFNNAAINVEKEEHEICPCCSVPEIEDEEKHLHHHDGECHCHEHTHRKVGIPYLVKKFEMNKKMFLIGEVHVYTLGGNKCQAYVSTQERLVERSEHGIRLNRDGQEVELVAPGEVDRNIPGTFLCNRFMDFFNKKLLAALS